MSNTVETYRAWTKHARVHFFWSSTVQTYLALVKHGQEQLFRSSTIEIYRVLVKTIETYRTLVEAAESKSQLGTVLCTSSSTFIPQCKLSAQFHCLLFIIFNTLAKLFFLAFRESSENQFLNKKITSEISSSPDYRAKCKLYHPVL